MQHWRSAEQEKLVPAAFTVSVFILVFMLHTVFFITVCGFFSQVGLTFFIGGCSQSLNHVSETEVFETAAGGEVIWFQCNEVPLFVTILTPARPFCCSHTIVGSCSVACRRLVKFVCRIFVFIFTSHTALIRLFLSVVRDGMCEG